MDRIDKLRSDMNDLNLEGFLIGSKAAMYYMSGFTGTYGEVLITQNEKFIFADGRYFEQLKHQSPDFEVIDNQMRMTETIVGFLNNKRIKCIGFNSNEMNAEEYIKLTKNDITLIEANDLINRMRMIKDDTEISKIKKAAEIADKTFEHVLEYIKVGMSEKQVANEIDNYGLSLGADGVAFETIVASGTRSALPHGHASNKIIQNNEMIILDFGFVVEKYYSDITRTIAIGKISEELKNAYGVTLEAQKMAIEASRKGTKFRDVDQTARAYITEMGYGKNFLHGTGHSIGLDVHEYPLVNTDSLEVIKEGAIFTVEPGIYLENKGGIRIEDDVYIDKSGNSVVLTNSIKELVEL